MNEITQTIEITDITQTKVAERQYDPKQDEKLVVEIIAAIKEVRETPQRTKISPKLYDYIDIEAVENLLFQNSERTTDRESNTAITFKYLDYTVVVEDSGCIEIYASPESDTEQAPVGQSVE